MNTANASHSSAEFNGPEIVSTRVFAAPREAVFQAFSDPAQLVHWWGPKGFTNTFHAFDFRVGGAWEFALLGPDGADYPNRKDFVEIVENERIVFHHLQPMHVFTMTMTFADEAGGTRLTWIMQFTTPDESGQLKDFIATANEENFDRLEAWLASAGS